MTQASSTPAFNFGQAYLQDLAHLFWCHTFDWTHVPAERAKKLRSEKNSPAAAGSRMRRFLRHLIDHPVPFTPDVSRIYRAILPHCQMLTPLQTYVLRSLLPASANLGYEPVPDVVELRFPGDHALKTRAQVGWHFLVGSCWDTEGQEYGVEMMFYGNAIFPPALAEEYGLSELENQSLEMQLAISVAGGRHHQAVPVVASGTSGLIEASAAPFLLKVGKNTLQSLRDDRLLPLRVQAWGVDQSEPEPIEIELDLVLASGKACLPQGEGGATPSIDGIGTSYYSIPNIALDETASTLRVGKRHVKLARGLFWFDHQWGYLAGVNRSKVMRAASALARPAPPGWDWFEAQFTGDRQLTVFAPHQLSLVKNFYHQTGTTPPGPLQLRVGGKFMAADETISTVWGNLTITDWVRAERSPCPDRYPPTHTWHPNRWAFIFDSLPQDIRTFTLVPIVEGGQAMIFAHGAQISEGAARVLNQFNEEVGRGFAESVLYADTRLNMLRLAGLPSTPHMLEIVGERGPSLLRRAFSAIYVATHFQQLKARLRSARGLGFFTAPQPFNSAKKGSQIRP